MTYDPYAGNEGMPSEFANKVLHMDELAKLPPPDPLIDGTIERNTTFAVVGWTGTLKSFAMLDWGLSVATGRTWLDRIIRTDDDARFLYVSAEGAGGIHRRARAWEEHHHVELTRDHFAVYPRPLNLGDERSVKEAVAYVAGEGVLIVGLDTLSKCMPGMDENSARDMNIAVEALERIRDATGNGVAGVAHHTSKDRQTTRGSSALESGVDTVYKAAGDSCLVTFSREKRKDGACEDEFQLRFQSVPGTHSGIAVPVTGVAAVDSSAVDRFYAEFLRLYGDTAVSRSRVSEDMELSKSRASAHLTALVRDGRLMVWSKTSNSPRYSTPPPQLGGDGEL